MADLTVGIVDILCKSISQPPSQSPRSQSGDADAGPSKNELKKRAKEEEKARKAAERKAKEEEAARQKAAEEEANVC